MSSRTPAIAISSDQLFWGLGPNQWLLIAPALGNASQGGTSALARIPPSKLLKIMQRLLSEAALVSPRPSLQQLMQELRENPNLQGRHRRLCSTSQRY
jgi:hypothetical protein